MDSAEGEIAIRELNEKEFDGRNIKVNEARDREESETRSYRN
jgi:RNA recognition motif-containing protein